MARPVIRVLWEFERYHASMEIKCERCGRIVIIPPKLVLETMPRLISLDDLPKRLKCQQCGARKPSITALYRRGR